MNERKIDATAFAAELAQHLDGWQAEPKGGDERENWRRSAILHESGARVAIIDSYDKPGAWHLFGVWPRGVKGEYRSARDWGAIAYGEREPKMNCSQTRSVAAIAGQFRRALEAQVLEIHAKCAEAAEKSGAWHKRRLEIARELAQALGGELRGVGAPHDHLAEPMVWLRGRAPGSIDLRPSDDNSVRIEGYLTAREALDLAPILNPLPPSHEDSPERAERLERFARAALHILHTDEEWGGDTLQAIGQAAHDLLLAFDDQHGRFRAHAWARPDDGDCDLCGCKAKAAGGDLCEGCQGIADEVAEELDAHLYGTGEVQS
jgi:hypothetical protein